VAWEEQLFALLDDLEQQAGALWDAERAPELADRSRAAYAEVGLASRLMAAVDAGGPGGPGGPGSTVGLDLVGVGLLTGRLQRVARGWCLLAAHDHDWVVRTAAVRAVHGAPVRAVPEVAWPAAARLGLGSALRRLAEAGERCTLHRVDGVRHDGVVRRVGADFLELALDVEGPGGVGRPGHRGEQVVLVALDGLAAVQSRDLDREPG
jgi:hypothetical protein